MSTINERIAREVMGFELNANGMIETWLPPRSDGSKLRDDLCVPAYDTNPTDALSVLKKCAEECTMSISLGSTGFWIGDCDKKSRYAIGPTLESAICAFALKLFEK